MISVANKRIAWEEELNSFDINYKDIGFDYDYLNAFCKKDEQPILLIYKSIKGKYGLPLIISKLPNYLSLDYYDAFSPPGYSGPISNNINSEFLTEALEKILIFLKKKKFICFLFKLITFLNNHYLLLHSNFKVVLNRKIIFSNLSIQRDIL